MFKERIYIFIYYFLKMIVFILPKSLLNFLALFVAQITFWCNSKHRKIIDINLKLCFPEKSPEERKQIALKIYQNFAKFGIDCIENQNTTKEKILKKVHFDNEELLIKAVHSKRSLILTTAHYGNWELCALAYAARFGAMSIVSRALDSKAMDKILSQNRTQFDMQIIDKKGGLKKMIKALKDKRTLGILTDQDASANESMRVKFFDKEVNFLMGASVIAKKMDALLLSAFIYQKEGKYHIKCFEIQDSRLKSSEELTFYQAKCCEEMIKFKPDEYFFFHKRFRSFDKELYKN
ncbi:lipid A biosynthesis lauroyl acyltransferase [Campylobacter cuniculorum]|uniref:Lipid A biosynthesis lauroyl acyltransferase n=2 Tax=Campylobacter cuniculorum TaxID=374106 RepID=A0A1W6BXB4_9BACT|nr:lipid A biosynthesis lauroyl acyltransferase [Campylobacter cuniculorum]ARJ56756.1 lipid A biosynthesis lauroyl acyltransferase [Campylobacter cuniculorum DSM 23162 = LMG 24588]QOR04227.1 lauroyl acyltransferase [Campylobacter cuniculorum]